jgi:hypothetical protein
MGMMSKLLREHSSRLETLASILIIGALWLCSVYLMFAQLAEHGWG